MLLELEPDPKRSETPPADDKDAGAAITEETTPVKVSTNVDSTERLLEAMAAPALCSGRQLPVDPATCSDPTSGMAQLPDITPNVNGVAWISSKSPPLSAPGAPIKPVEVVRRAPLHAVVRDLTLAFEHADNTYLCLDTKDAVEEVVATQKGPSFQDDTADDTPSSSSAAGGPTSNGQPHVLVVPFRPPRRQPVLPSPLDAAAGLDTTTMSELRLGRASPESVVRGLQTSAKRGLTPSPPSAAIKTDAELESAVADVGSPPELLSRTAIQPSASSDCLLPASPVVESRPALILSDCGQDDTATAGAMPGIEARIILASDTVPGFDLRVLQRSAHGKGIPLRVARVSVRARHDVMQAVTANLTAAARALLRPAGHPKRRAQPQQQQQHRECAPHDWLVRAARHSMLPIVVIGCAEGAGVVVGTSAAVHAAAIISEGDLPPALAMQTACSAGRQALHFVQDLSSELRGQAWFRTNAVGAAVAQARLSWMRTRGGLLMCLQDGLAEPSLQMRLGGGQGTAPLWVQAACILAGDLSTVLPGGLARWGLGQLAVCSSTATADAAAVPFGATSSIHC